MRYRLGGSVYCQHISRSKYAGEANGGTTSPALRYRAVLRRWAIRAIVAIIRPCKVARSNRWMRAAAHQCQRIMPRISERLSLHSAGPRRGTSQLSAASASSRRRARPRPGLPLRLDAARCHRTARVSGGWARRYSRPSVRPREPGQDSGC